MKKILAIMVAVILCLSFVTACSDENNDSAKSSLDTTIVATVDGYEITLAEYNCHYFVNYSEYEQYSSYYGENWMDQDLGDGQTMGELIKSNAMREIEMFVTALKVAKDRFGITEADVKADVDKQFEELVKSYGSEAAFSEFLVSAHTTNAALRKYFERYEIYSLLAEKMLEEGKDITVTDAEAKEMFETQYSNLLKVQHILVATVADDGVSPGKSDEEAMKIVDEVLAKLEDGADFDSLIEEYDEDPGMVPGQYYVFGDGEMVPEFEEASKKLAVGEYTKQAVKTSYGYHIIKRYALDETSDEYKNMKVSLAQEKLYLFVEGELANMNFEWDKEAIDNHIDIWLQEIATVNSSSAN